MRCTIARQMQAPPSCVSAGDLCRRMRQPSAKLAAFRIAAAGALVAVFDADEGRLAAFRALPEMRAGETEGGPRRPLAADGDHLGGQCPLVLAVLWRQEADLDHVALDDVADRGEQRRNVAALH